MCIDFHSHILPRMDDGSESQDVSGKLLKLLEKQGVDVVCATSHFYRDQNSISTYLQRRQKAYAALRDCDTDLEVILGAETAYFHGMDEEDELNKLCLTGTNVLLLEMPMSVWSSNQIGTVTRLVLDRGFDVVLAHPERYLFDKGNRKAIERFMDMQLGIQVNAGSIAAWGTRREALELLSDADRPFLGSDTHNLTSRPPKIESARKIISRKLGRDAIKHLDRTMQKIVGPALKKL